jgi:catechol 2,3-dioxygenase-like lactoylglutathione lyase family enzyme
MAAPSVDTLAKFHASFNVADLGRSVAFYRAFLGRDPAKHQSDYAKFERDEPPLVLSLIPGHANPGGTLNHVGIRLPNSQALIQMQMRLATAGIPTQREEGVECCHSRQTKFWVRDPDQTLWELYVLLGDMDEHHESSVPAQKTGDKTGTEQVRVTWQHQIPETFPTRIPHEDNSVHAVILEGTANMEPASLNLNKVLNEVYRVLRPGGEVSIHCLAGNKIFDQHPPSLPGPAAVVQHVPLETDPMKAMTGTGFVQVHFQKLSPSPYFVVHGVEMREILLVGRKPGHRPRSATHQAIYLGPLAQVTDDHGNVFRRGERVSLNIHDWQLLSQSAAAGQFQLFSPATVQST